MEVPDGYVYDVGSGPITAYTLNCILKGLQINKVVAIKCSTSSSDFNHDFHQIELDIIAAHEARKERPR
jgi:hypothetical protein